MERKKYKPKIIQKGVAFQVVNKLPDGNIGSKLKNINALNPFKLIFIFLFKLEIFWVKKDMINNRYKTNPTIPVSVNSSDKVLWGWDEQLGNLWSGIGSISSLHLTL